MNFERIIDLGDGSGVQKFEAPTMEELIDKLAEAQLHATRKIRELATENRDLIEQAEGILAAPRAAVQKMFHDATGLSVEEFHATRDRITAQERQAEDNRIAAEFMQKTPEFLPTPLNGQKIANWLKNEKLPLTVENVEKAVADLNAGGLLEKRTAPPESANARVVGQRRAASGLSNRGSTATKRVELTEDDLYNLSYEELRRGAMREAMERER